MLKNGRDFIIHDCIHARVIQKQMHNCHIQTFTILLMVLLMVEQPQMCKGNSHVIFVRRFDHMVVPDGTARFRHVLNAAAVGPLDIVAEGEESVAA